SNEAAPNLLGTGQFAVVGIELLGQHEEAPDLSACQHLVDCKRAVHLRDMLRQHVGDAGMVRKLLIGAVRDGIALGPVANGRKIDIEHDGRERTTVPERHRFPDIGKELELVLDIFWREQGAVRETPYVLRTIYDLQMSGCRIDEAGVAGLNETIARQRLGGLGLIPE